jgi:hypothetical protein
VCEGTERGKDLHVRFCLGRNNVNTVRNDRKEKIREKHRRQGRREKEKSNTEG